MGPESDNGRGTLCSSESLEYGLDDHGSTIPGHLIYKYPILTVELPVSSSPSYISPSETATSLITSSASVQTAPTSIPTSTSVPSSLSLSSPATKLSVASVTRDPETISLTSKPIPQTSSFTKTETKIVPSTTFIKVPEPVGVIASNGPTSSAMASATHEPSRELSSSFTGSETSTQSSGSLVPPSSSPVASNYEYSHTTSHALAITGLTIGIFSVVLVVVILGWKHYQRRRRRRREEESTWDGHASMQQLHGSPLHAFPFFDESFGASWQKLKHRFFRREKISQESDLSQVSAMVAVVSSDSSHTSQLRRQTVPDDIHTAGSVGPASYLPVPPVVARSNLARAPLPAVQEHGERLSVPAFRHQDSGWREPMVNRPSENQGEIDEGKVEMPLIELPPNYTTS
ncbi:hypothetical protein C8R42DRAFT_648889 [Lentinula raphanica]|nr:hypothetical protein C8R42DRAFT_648889 [Lentinula raphanica]